MEARISQLAVWLLLAALIASTLTACMCRRSLEIGQSVPDLTLLNTEGEEVALADFRSQVTLLNFWATWCEPCKREMPIFQSLLDTHGEDGLSVVLIALGDEPADVADYVREHGYTFASLVDIDGAVERTYGIDTLPSTLLLDSEGMLRESWTGPMKDEDALARWVVALLPAAAPTPAVTVTPIPTATPSPLPTQLSTLTPSLTLSPTISLPSPSPTPTPVPPTLTPTPRGYPAPVLLSPDDGAHVVPGSHAELRWSWDGVLGEDEHFDVRFWQEGAPHYGVTWTKESAYAVKGDPGKTYYWAVAVIRGKDGNMQEQLSLESSARRLVWDAPSEPTKVSASYGLSLQCGQPSKTGNPGKVVVFDVDLVNTGTAEDTFDLSISPSLPTEWQGMFCIGDECYTSGTHSVTVPAGGTQLVQIKIKSAGDAQAGQKGNVTLAAVSQGDSSRSGSVTVTLTVE